MKKLDDLKKNLLHDQEDEYRNPMKGRDPWMLTVIVILVIALIFYGLHLLTTYVRAL